MKSRTLALTLLVLLAFSMKSLADELPVIRAATLASGTVNWELQHIKNQKLDLKNGFVLQIIKVASLGAARLALTSNSADTIVSDWLWAAKREEKGDPLTFIPFSNQIGSVLTKDGSPITELKQLKGKRIGVAGGPLNKGWILLHAAALKEGINLAKDATVQYGAPPLLSQSLKKQQIDVLVTFWHYGARLKAEGYRTLIELNEIMRDLGMKTQLPMLGYLFKRSYAENHNMSIARFDAAIRQAKTELSAKNEHWQKLRPLMRAENEHIFNALIKGYIAGIPGAIDDHQIKDAQVFYRIINQTQSKSVESLNPAMFMSNSH